jgi:hypothetical protein
MRAIRQLSIVCLALSAAFGACSTDSSTGPNAQPAALGAVLSEMSLPALTTVASGLVGASVPSVAPIPSACAYDGASQSFVCPSVTAGGLTINQSYALLNAANAAQSQFDAASTAAVRVRTTAAGTLTSTSAPAITLDMVQEMTLSGLLTGIHTLDGTSTTHVSSPGGAGVLPFGSTTVLTTSQVVLPQAGSSSWPVSGSIAIDETGSGASFALPTVHMLLVFHGTSLVDFSVTAGGITRTCKLDLSGKSAMVCPGLF